MKLRHTLLTVLLLAASAVAQCPPGMVCPTGEYPPTEPVVIRWVGQASTGIFGRSERHPAICEVWVGAALHPASGTLVDVGEKYGTVLTAAHLFKQASPNIEIRFPNGKRYQGKLDASDRTADIAAVRIQAPEGVKPISVATTPAKVGDRVWFAGYGIGGYRRFDGRVVAYTRTKGQRTHNTMVLQPAARPGDSGAPILNADGELVAVLSARNDMRNETLGTFSGRINAVGYEWARNHLLPWNAETNQAEIQRESEREQGLIGLIQQGITQPVVLPPVLPPAMPMPQGPVVDVEARARLTVLEADVTIGRDLVARLGLLEADTEAVEVMAAMLSADVAKAQEAAEEAVAMVDDIDAHGDLAAVEALAATVEEAVEAVAEVKADAEAEAEKQETTDGWISVLLGMAGTALAGLIPGGGLALWALKRSGASEKAKDRIEGLATGALDRIERRLDGLTDRLPSAVNDLADSALKKTLAALKKQL